ncbi:stage II sporulation protein R [Caproiciproducens faecalis]|uniref:Stage II sporulation protein R n=1 Tax=Caproiciproducens faecalis TaxID=2820301 RepID=A0ABS7DRX6_9FIRM|nr:stage II sporulation protein R [Caproiciproducens faecalis]MBW7573560.1 stage II sporulation protein R [Caproiciproducens faecalis]
MKLFEKSLCLALILTVLFSFTGFAAGCEDIPNHVLRLHVLANSDSEVDQALKLKVRDRILAESKGLMDNVKDKTEAQEAVRAALPQLKAAAQDEISKQGFDYPVNVEMVHMYFTTREYQTVTLPAGDYDSLRVTIGKAAGHNWWCVIFPPMCLPAAEEPKELGDVLNANQLGIVEGKGEFEVKFKSVELYEQLKNYLEKK